MHCWFGLSHAVMSDSLWPSGLQSARLLCPWDSPGTNTGVGCSALFQGNVPDKPTSLMSLALAGRLFTTSATWDAYIYIYAYVYLCLYIIHIYMVAQQWRICLQCRDAGSVPGSRRSPGEGNGNPLQYSCLGNPMDREAWQATVHGVAKSQTRLSNKTTTICQMAGNRIFNVYFSLILFSFLDVSSSLSTLYFITLPWQKNIISCQVIIQARNMPPRGHVQVLPQS